MVRKPNIKINVTGIGAAVTFLKLKDKAILNAINNGVREAGFFIEGEVKQSIAGHRAEPVSVDTGRFLNSINMNQPKPSTAIISTPLDYPTILEFGGVNRPARRHFGNTKTRNKQRVTDFIQMEVNKI